SSATATAAVGDSPGASPAALTAGEQAAWEERLGIVSDTHSAWGRAVGAHLFAQPLYRQILHVAHAFRVLPFVAETPEGRFILESMDEVEFRERVTRLGRPDVAGVIGTLGEHRSSATTMATMLLDVLMPLDADDRAVVLAMVFRRLKGLVPAETPEPGQTSALTVDDRAAILVTERESARAILGALNHRECGHTTQEDVAGQVLAALDAIVDPMRRKVMMGFVIGQLSGASRQAAPSGLEALEALLEGSMPGVEVLRVG
ncbi:MAG: hypothetical protein Q7R80_03120, partial [bacterium]|nr:hypothetical protein [bacterium]